MQRLRSAFKLEVKYGVRIEAESRRAAEVIASEIQARQLAVDKYTEHAVAQTLEFRLAESSENGYDRVLRDRKAESVVRRGVAYLTQVLSVIVGASFLYYGMTNRLILWFIAGVVTFWLLLTDVLERRPA